MRVGTVSGMLAGSPPERCLLFAASSAWTPDLTLTAAAVLQYHPVPGSHGHVSYLVLRIIDYSIGIALALLVTCVSPWCALACILVICTGLVRQAVQQCVAFRHARPMQQAATPSWT